MSVVVVSWILTLLSVFGLTYAHEIRGESQLIQLEVERHQLRAWARSGVELARAQLDETASIDCAGLRSSGLDNLFALPLVCGRGRFTVGESIRTGGGEFWLPGIVDEAGRLPLSLADSISLAGLPGMSPAGVGAILEARNNAGENMFPPFGSLAGLDDLSRDCAEHFLSRYGDFVNVNSASSEVLVAVGLPANTVDKMLGWRAGSDGIAGTTDDLKFTSLESSDPGVAACMLNSEEAAILAYLMGTGKLSVATRYFSLASRGWGDGLRGVCEIRVVLEKPESGSTRVVEWTENWLN